MTFLELAEHLIGANRARSPVAAKYCLARDRGSVYGVRWHDGHVTGVSAELSDDLQAESALPHLDYVITDALTCRHVERLLVEQAERVLADVGIVE